MQKIYLKNDQADFLIQIISEDNVRRAFQDSKNTTEKNSNTVVVNLEKSQIELILDDLTQHLVSFGFDQTEQINGFGLEIEEFIDKFSRAYYSDEV